MAELEILSTKIEKPMSCACGHLIKFGDARAVDGRIEFLCPGCHAAILKIEYEVPEDYEPW